MSRRIILVQPPLETEPEYIDYPYHADLGIVQAAAVLGNNNEICSIDEKFDTVIVNSFAMPESDVRFSGSGGYIIGAPAERVINSIKNNLNTGEGAIIVSCNCINLSCNNPSLYSFLEKIRSLGPETPLLLADLYQGGQHYVQVPPKKTLSAYPMADAYLQHEAEGLIKKICMRLTGEGRPRKRWAASGGEAPFSDLPLPAWNLTDLEARNSFMLRVQKKLGGNADIFPVDGRTLPALTGRGCPYNCIHCSSNPGRKKAGKGRKNLSLENALFLVENLVKIHGAGRIQFLDEIINLDPDYFTALLEYMSSLDLNFEFPNGLRADLLEEKHFSLMSGRISLLSISAESGNQGVTDNIVRKKLGPGSIETALESAKKYNIPSMVHFIIGFPGESAKNINESLSFALYLFEKYGALPSIQFAVPFPGTRLFESIKDFHLPDTNFSFHNKPLTRGIDFTEEDLKWFKWSFEKKANSVHRFAKSSKNFPLPCGISSGNNFNSEEKGICARPIKYTAPQSRLILNLTYRCNNHCLFCATGKRNAIDGNFSKQKKRLIQFRNMGFSKLDIDGGEPTLYPHLHEIIRFASKKDYRGINITTNARMCSYEQFAKRLMNSGIDSILFSLHGSTKEIHEKLTKSPDSFIQTITGIKNCMKYNPGHVKTGINMTLTRFNQDDAASIGALAIESGINLLNIQFPTPFGRSGKEILPDTKRACAKIAELIDRKKNLKIKIINLPFCFMKGYEENLMEDLGKAHRYMVFANDHCVNLNDYLLARRYHTEKCEGCRYRIACGGFFMQDSIEEPLWAL